MFSESKDINITRLTSLSDFPQFPNLDSCFASLISTVSGLCNPYYSHDISNYSGQKNRSKKEQ